VASGLYYRLTCCDPDVQKMLAEGRFIWYSPGQQKVKLGAKIDEKPF